MSIKAINNNSKTIIAFFILYFVGALTFSFLVPYQLDDWAWGGQIGLDRLSNWFDNYSGRYIGNLIVLALTRSVVLHSFVMAGCFTGIVWLIYKITGSQKSGHIISAVLLLLMPLAVFNQTVAWISGFANYVTSTFFVLVYILETNDIYKDEKPKQSIAKSILFAVLGFISSMIVEHVTLYCVVFSVYVIVFTLIKHKKFLFRTFHIS